MAPRAGSVLCTLEPTQVHMAPRAGSALCTSEPAGVRMAPWGWLCTVHIRTHSGPHGTEGWLCTVHIRTPSGHTALGAALWARAGANAAEGRSKSASSWSSHSSDGEKGQESRKLKERVSLLTSFVLARNCLQSVSFFIYIHLGDVQKEDVYNHILTGICDLR